MRRVFVGIAAVLGALLVLLLAYAAYVLLNLQRIEDKLPLKRSKMRRRPWKPDGNTRF